MDRFEALPLPQRVLIIFLAMALVAGGFYFLLIADAQEAIATERQKASQAEEKIQALKVYEDSAQLEALLQEEKEITEQLEANKALLPEEDRIPALITAIKRQADERGLKIMKFRKNPRELDDYVALVPVEMEVQGSFPVLISFLEALAQPGMRMMTVSELELDYLPVKNFMGDGAKPQSWRDDPTQQKLGAKGGGGSWDDANNPTTQFIRRLDDFADALTRYQIKARFTVNAYSYTGKPLTPEERQMRKRGRRARR